MKELHAPQRVLLGPGPSTVHPRVLQAMSNPVVGHLDPAFFQVMDDVCDMLRQVFHTNNNMTLPISSTGTGAMETACANILEPGDSVLICRNGYFGVRLADIAERCGATVHLMDTPWGMSVNPQMLRDELKKHSGLKAVGLVHAETSTGVLSDVKELVEVQTWHPLSPRSTEASQLWQYPNRWATPGKCLATVQNCLEVGPRTMEYLLTCPRSIIRTIVS